MARTFCTVCGVPSADGSRFCSACGAALVAAGAAAPPEAGIVTVPAWMGDDWGTALRVSLIGQGILLAAGAALTVVTLVARALDTAQHDLDVAKVVLGPLRPLLAWAGGGGAGGRGGQGIGALPGLDVGSALATAIVVSLVAYGLAGRLIAARLRPIAADRVRLAAAAFKIGVTTAGVLFVIALVVNVTADDVLAHAVGVGVTGRVPLLSVAVQGALVATIGGARALLVQRGSPIGALIDRPIPWQLRSGVAGGTRVLLLTVPTLALLWVAGTWLELVVEVDLPARDALAVGLTALAQLVVTWVDTGLLLLLGASQLLYDGGVLWWAGRAQISWWMWLGPIIVVAAYVVGGRRAAVLADATSRAQAAVGALLVGPVVAVAVAVAADGVSRGQVRATLVLLALLVPTAWGVVAVAAAWLRAGSDRLPPGLSVRRY